MPLLQELRPKTVLDVGNGLGKSRFLIHEYVGIGEATSWHRVTRAKGAGASYREQWAEPSHASGSSRDQHSVALRPGNV